MTYGNLATAVEKPTIDPDLQAALTILAASPIAVLETKAFFIDFDGKKHELTSDEFGRAQKGHFLHPLTGCAVKDFEDRIVPFFAVSDRFHAED